VGILPLKTTPPRGRETASDGPAARRGPGRWPSLAGPTLKRLDLPLIAITGIAAFLRLWDLGRVGLRGDEAVYAGQAAVLAGAKGFSRYFILIGRGNSNFLLFQEILSVVYRVTGVGDVTARVVAASFSVLTVLVTYWIAATLFGRRTGLLSALLLAVSAYSVSLGRLALLDSVLTFFFCAAILCAVKWISTRRSGWLYGFAATAALTLQAKVPGGLVLLVLAGYLLLARSLRELTLRRVLVAAAVFIAALTPALVQLTINGPVFLEFLSTSVRRGSDVPWYYYGQVLVSYEGPLMLALWITGIAFAIGRRSRADALLLLWLLAVIGFYELYPLKAFNYLLPAIPALSILSGRALGALLQWLEEHIHRTRARTLRLPGRAPGAQLQWLKEHIHWPRARTLRRLSAGGLSLVVVATAVPYLQRTLRDNSFVGLKDAAIWMRAKTPPSAGVMTISHGSAQYVFAFYAHHNAYPFGRFNLATVLPGGRIIMASAPPPGARTPRDWVTRWPHSLIASGQVSYLVYYTTAMDDPPVESQVVDTSTQRQFRLLIERYGGELVHTVYYQHEGRAWIYRLTARLPHPVLSFTVRRSAVTLDGIGFTKGAALTATYNGKQVGRGRADAAGAVTLPLALPVHRRPRYLIVVTDSAGRYASLVVPKPMISYSTENGIATVTGVSFEPNSPVTVTYHSVVLARGRSAGDGSVSVFFRTPTRIFPRWQLVARDGAGNNGSLKLLRAKLTARISGNRVTVYGSGYPPGELVTAIYHGRFMMSAKADRNGSITLTFPLPAGAQSRWLLFVRDPAGHFTTVIHPRGRR
jgi:4-amino-4-deoxy-L-arabinose transferase-like glycosyltransferase